METSAAVYIKSAHKSYGKKKVLENLNLHVRRGNIYGLLGASGCGKTTLLSCVVGRKELNSGEVWVLGGHPGTVGSGVPGPRVGYMPQEIALVDELTIKEMVAYFGTIMGMSDKEIDDGYEELSNILDLPHRDQFVGTCSGGQKRRVSLASAMIHLPELLILDEPTAGVDPVLREKIWNYLAKIADEEKLAVIITTHYIEETRQADMIGLMRDGRLLAEDSPTNLLRNFEVGYLEDVFLILSQRQEASKLENYPAILEDSACPLSDSCMEMKEISSNARGDNVEQGVVHSKKRRRRVTISNYGFSTRRMKALMTKNWKKYYRNTFGAVFQVFLLPILEILTFLGAVGLDMNNVALAIVSEEAMAVNCLNFTRAGTAVAGNGTDCNFANLSCRFLDSLNHPMINKIKYDSISEGFKDARSGKVVGVMYMAKNFTDSFQERFNSGREADGDVIHFGEIKVWLDMSNRQIGETMKFKLWQIYEEFQEGLLKDCKLYPKLGEPIRLEYIYGGRNDTTTVSMIPGAVMLLLFFCATLTACVVIVADRTEGIWDRSIVSGVTSVELTLSHLLFLAGVTLLHTIQAIVIVFPIFTYQSVGSKWLLSLIAFVEGITGICFGFLISTVSSSHSMSLTIAMGSFYIVVFICGFMWPIQGMYEGLQMFSKALPFTSGIESFRDVMQKGWDLTYSRVYVGLLIDVAWILAFLAISVIILKRTG